MWAEWLRCPAGFMEQLIAYRAYEGAKAMFDRATTPEARKALPASELIDLVAEVRSDLVREEMAKKKK